MVDILNTRFTDYPCCKFIVVTDWLKYFLKYLMTLQILTSWACIGSMPVLCFHSENFGITLLVAVCNFYLPKSLKFTDALQLLLKSKTLSDIAKFGLHCMYSSINWTVKTFKLSQNFSSNLSPKIHGSLEPKQLDSEDWWQFEVCLLVKM